MIGSEYILSLPEFNDLVVMSPSIKHSTKISDGQEQNKWTYSVLKAIEQYSKNLEHSNHGISVKKISFSNQMAKLQMVKAT